jgi:hypothetical protein
MTKKLDWLESEKNKDKIELDRQKSFLINEIKKLKKDDIVIKKQTKISLWKRIMKVLMG